MKGRVSSVRASAVLIQLAQTECFIEKLYFMFFLLVVVARLFRLQHRPFPN